jgi:hypothetical protein
MRPLTLLRGLFLAASMLAIGNALAATEVEFGSNQTVDEDDGVVWIKIVRTGDLSITSVVNFYELWSYSGTTLDPDELLYNHVAAPSAVWWYGNSSRYGTVIFNAGVSSVRIPYSITNDQEVEGTERLYFELRNASSGTTIGDDSLYVKVYDDDEPTPILDVFSDDVDEGETARVRVRVTPEVSYPISFEVYTLGDTARNNEDYNGFTAKDVTISANDDGEYVRIGTYHNDDPNDRQKEMFELCIEPNSVPNGVLVGQRCGQVYITDVPPPPPASLPILDLIEDGLVLEGTTDGPYAELREPATTPVSFLVSTWRSTYEDANWPDAESDYHGLVDVLFSIPAGQTRVAIPIVIHQNDDPTDNQYESTEVCINTGSVSGATLGTACVPLTITDVPPPPPASLPILDLIEDGLVLEGTTDGPYAELREPATTPVSFLVSTWRSTYEDANWPDAESDYHGLVDVLFSIPAGQTRVAIPIVIHQNDDPTDNQYESTEVCINTGSVSGATLGTACVPLTIMDVPSDSEPDSTPPTATPTAVVYDEGFASGWGSVGGFDRQVNTNSQHGFESSLGIWFRTTAVGGRVEIYPTTGCTFNTTGYHGLSFAYNLGEDEGEFPYIGLLDSSGTVFQYVSLDTQTPFTWQSVTFDLATLGAVDETICGLVFGTTGMGTLELDAIAFTDAADVPPEEEVEEGELIAADLVAQADVFAELEATVGTDDAAMVVCTDSADLAQMARTLSVHEMIGYAFRQVLLGFPSCANAQVITTHNELPSGAETEAEVISALVLNMRRGYLLSPNQYGVLSAATSLNWTAATALAEQNRHATAVANNAGWPEDVLLLQAGDYVDGRLVIHQPWVAFDADGEYLATRSAQGRFVEGMGNSSHRAARKLSMDVTANADTMYYIAPADAEVIDVQYDLEAAYGVYGPANTGNIVTLLLDDTMADGTPIYLTVGHLVQLDEPSENPPIHRSLLKRGNRVNAGQVLGLAGNTGGYNNVNGVWTAYPRHAHFQFGSSVYPGRGVDLIEARIADGNDQKDAEGILHPQRVPVYLLGINPNLVSPLSSFGLGNEEQDYGFPKGSGGNGSYVVRQGGIYPTLPKTSLSFLSLQQAHFTNSVTQPARLDYIPGTAGNDHYHGSSGDDVFISSDGDDFIDCGDGYDQLNAEGPDGRIANNRFIADWNGNVIMQRTDGTARKVLRGCEGVWFGVDGQWREFSEVITTDSAYTDVHFFGTDITTAELFNGTAAANVFFLGNGANYCNASLGGDVYYGGTDYDQLSLPGSSTEYTFTAQDDDSVEVTGPGIGTDYLFSIDGYWFRGDSAWQYAGDRSRYQDRRPIRYRPAPVSRREGVAVRR